jgi:hypothetical protein
VGLTLASALAYAGTLTVNFKKDTLYEITSDVENKRVAEIKEAVKATNERLADFSITREGSLITLGFAMWTDGDKIEFNLVGKKPDYYRMAMGVGLEDTLKELAKADKRIAPVGATKDTDTIHLTVMFGENGAPPPAPKPVRVSAKAPPKAAQPKAAPPPAPAAKTQSDTKTEDSEWQRIKDTGTTADFKKFLKTYPKSMHKYAAKRKIAEVATKEAEKLKKIEEEKKQLAEAEKKRKAKQKKMAKEKEKKLEQEKKRLAEQKKKKAEQKKKLAAQKKQKNKELAAKKIADAFASAKKANTTKALEKFISANPKSKYVAEAKALSVTARDHEAYASSNKTRKGVEGYLKKYPKGKHVKDARVLLGKMDDDETFLSAKGSLNKLESYLAKYPKGRNTKEANALIEKLLSFGPMRLRAPAVKTAPVIDGKGSDAAWKNVRPLTVKLKREGKGSHIPKATIKAVHSGDKLYILAQWKDKSQDTDYRPYKWDDKANKHVVTEKMDDGFAVAIYKGKATDDSCMLTGKSHEVDLWVWRAFLSGISGMASDQSIVTSRERMRKSTPHLAKNGKGQVWVRNLPDKGKLGWQYVVPLPDAPHESIPSYKACKPSGSAADVSARGSWDKGVWTVEFSRALKTGNPDDADIPAKGQVMVSFAAYDKADRENHSSGDIVRLELQR